MTSRKDTIVYEGRVQRVAEFGMRIGMDRMGRYVMEKFGSTEELLAAFISDAPEATTVYFIPEELKLNIYMEMGNTARKTREICRVEKVAGNSMLCIGSITFEMTTIGSKSVVAAMGDGVYVPLGGLWDTFTAQFEGNPEMVTSSIMKTRHATLHYLTSVVTAVAPGVSFSPDDQEPNTKVWYTQQGIPVTKGMFSLWSSAYTLGKIVAFIKEKDAGVLGSSLAKTDMSSQSLYISAYDKSDINQPSVYLGNLCIYMGKDRKDSATDIECDFFPLVVGVVEQGDRQIPNKSYLFGTPC